MLCIKLSVGFGRPTFWLPLWLRVPSFPNRLSAVAILRSILLRARALSGQSRSSWALGTGVGCLAEVISVFLVPILHIPCISGISDSGTLVWPRAGVHWPPFPVHEGEGEGRGGHGDRDGDRGDGGGGGDDPGGEGL